MEGPTLLLLLLLVVPVGREERRCELRATAAEAPLCLAQHNQPSWEHRSYFLFITGAISPQSSQTTLE